jgi:Fe-Mn family superoxide dismutase
MNMDRRTALKTVALAPAVTPVLLAAAQNPAPAADAPTGPYKLDPLPYAYDALEPFIDAKTMEIHHGRHHAAYVRSLNTAVQGHPDLAQKSPKDLISNLGSVPENIRAAVRNHGGGHVEALVKVFGDYAKFREEFTRAAMSVFGSGWAWLSMDPKTGTLGLEATPNQDSPYMAGRVPLLGLDVWEHAYYLKYQNKRADYVAAFFNVINWDVVAQRLANPA